jgi:2EXR family
MEDLPGLAGVVETQDANSQSTTRGEKHEQGGPMAGSMLSTTTVSNKLGTPNHANSTDAEPTDLTEFTLFPKFPAELRLKIWKEALPDPKVVEIEYCGAELDWFSPKPSKAKPSGLVLANQESGDVYLKNHISICKLVAVSKDGWYGERRKQSGGFCSHAISQYGMFYFNPTIDILYLGPSASRTFCLTVKSVAVLAKKSWMQNITTLACEWVEYRDSIENWYSCC